MLTLQVEDVMELLGICLTTTYFQIEDKFYQQKEGMAVGNSPSLVVNNIFMEHFREIALDTADHKPAKWLRYFDNSLMVWPHTLARWQQFLHYHNCLRPTMNSQSKLKLMILFLSWMSWS
jgi:hypothetical protein